MQGEVVLQGEIVAAEAPPQPQPYATAPQPVYSQPAPVAMPPAAPQTGGKVVTGEVVTEQPGAAAVALFGRYSPEAGSLEVLQPTGELVTVVPGIPEKTVKHLRTKMHVQKAINDLAPGLGLHYWTLSLEAGGETYVTWNTTGGTISARDLEGCWIGGLFIPVLVACFKIQPKSDDEFNVGGATCGVLPWYLCANRADGPRQFCLPLACQRWDFNEEGDYLIGYNAIGCPVWHAKRVC